MDPYGEGFGISIEKSLHSAVIFRQKYSKVDSLDDKIDRRSFFVA